MRTLLSNVCLQRLPSLSDAFHQWQQALSALRTSHATPNQYRFALHLQNQGRV
ncbi:hypothetical protein FHS28_004051 [Roseateles terrae]|uniref:Uncharacterized protein n=1 Tax=Roseateles terrae TaxID=431060 RepID=A0ABR6GX36_9BURK|nr:hypothetical protein [Roseateles terrae]